MPRIFSAVCLLVFIGGVRAASPDEQFEKVIRPLLVEKCIGCHGDGLSGGKTPGSLATV